MMIKLFIALPICYKSHHITKDHLREYLTLMKISLLCVDWSNSCGYSNKMPFEGVRLPIIWQESVHESIYGSDLITIGVSHNVRQGEDKGECLPGIFLQMVRVKEGTETVSRRSRLLVLRLLIAD